MVDNCDLPQRDWRAGMKHGTPTNRTVRLLVRINGQVQDMPEDYEIDSCHLPATPTALELDGCEQILTVNGVDLDLAPLFECVEVLSGEGAPDEELVPTSNDYPFYLDTSADITYVYAAGIWTAVGTPQVQSNWTEANPAAPSFIVNKPTIPPAGVTDVTNGTAEAGAIPLVGSSGTTRTVARIKPLTSDVTVTAGATITDPVAIGLSGTTLKYWAEASTAIDASTQRLTWQPKDPNGTFVRANTVQVIAVPRGITFRDPLESGSSFPASFRSGLDIQIKGTTGTNGTFPNGGYCFGEGNRTSNASGIAVGISNTSGNYAITYGYNNSVANAMTLGTAGVAIGSGNTASSSLGVGGMAIGINNNATGFANAFGHSNTVSNPNISNITVGSQITNTSGGFVALGLFNSGTGNTYGMGIGQRITQTASNSSIVAGAINNGSVGATDQGIAGFQQFGRLGRIPLIGVVNTITNWTNTAWRDAPAGSMTSLYGGNSSYGHFSAMFLLELKQSIAAGGTQVPVRIGAIKLECWALSAGVIPTIKVLEGGDADFLTYFDFQFVTFGTAGVKLQYKLISDPSGGSPNAGKLTFAGNIHATISAI